MAGIDAYVTGLYHFDDSWADASGNGLAFSVGTESGFSSTNKKFGTAAQSHYNWGPAWKTAAASGQNAFGSGDFTIDCWVRFRRNDQAKEVIICTANTSSSYWELVRRTATDIEFYARSSSGVTASFKTSTSPVSTTGVWYHIAVVRNGSNEYIFVNGESQSLTISQGFSGSLGTATAAPLQLGYDSTNFAGQFGYLDELRISKGIARWTSNFTPAGGAYSVADISGVLSEEARVIMIDEASWEIEHNSTHGAGSYLIAVNEPNKTKIVIGVPTASGTAPTVYKNILPAT
jgi:hypothetical protein